MVRTSCGSFCSPPSIYNRNNIYVAPPLVKIHSKVRHGMRTWTPVARGVYSHRRDCYYSTMQFIRSYYYSDDPQIVTAFNIYDFSMEIYRKMCPRTCNIIS